MNNFLNIPDHVGFIPDGIRRWAVKNNVTEIEAYNKAMDKINIVLDTIFGLGSNTLTVYILSKDNLDRSPETLATIYEAETNLFVNLLPKIAKKWDCQMEYAGDLSRINDQIYTSSLKQLCENTKKYNKRKIYLLSAYDPIDELNFAISKSRNTQKKFTENLWIPNNIDLLIRTGKETRISKFPPLQISYAEIYFLDKLFVDVEKEDIYEVFNFFDNKKRRFGK